MGDTLDRMMNRGWEKMSKSLDNNLPVNRISHLNRFRNYYSIAMVFLFFILAIVWLNDGTVILQNGLDFRNKAKTLKLKENNNISNSNELIFPYVKKNSSFSHESYWEPSILRSENDFLLIIDNINGRRNVKIPVLNSDRDQSVEFLPSKGNLKLKISEDLLDKKLVMNIGKQIDNENTNYVGELPVKDFKHNTVSISLNSINEDFKSFGGIDGGINYAYKINRNIGFMTGIEHSLFSRDRMDYDLDNLEKAVNGVMRGEEQNQIAEDRHNINSFSERLYYVGIPIGFLYSIDKFTVSAGVKFSYLISASDLTGTESQDNQRIMASLREVSPSVSEVYNKINYSFIFGFEFHVLKDFSVFSRFNYAYSNIVNSYSYNENAIGDLFIVSGFENDFREKLDKNIYFGLGIKYDLAKK